MADPSQLSDEELQTVIDTGVEPEAPESPVEEPTETPEPLEETPEPVEVPEEEPPAEQEGAEQAPAEAPPSNRLLTRAQKLLEKYGPPQQRPQVQQPSQPSPGQLDYNQALDADAETIQALQADRQRYADAQYLEGLRRAEFIEFKTNIRLDLPLIEDKMKKLDPRDAEALDKEYLYTVGFDPQTQTVQNPNIGYAEFIEARIEMAERMGSAMSAETAKNIAKQTAATGLRPDGSSAKRLNLNRAPSEMTMEELYASIGQTPPKK